MRRIILIVCLIAMAGTVPSKADEPSEDKAREALAKALADPFDEGIFQDYLRTLPFDGTYYVIEGDLRVTENEVRHQLVSSSGGSQAATGNPELLVAIYHGERSYWKEPATRVLTYAINKSSFESAEQYALVQELMTAAGKDWLDSCNSCGIEFRYLSQHDDGPSHSDVLFIVQSVDTGGDYIAAAFFPHYAPERRYLNIDKSFFDTSFSQVGVLRHELGHVLGYRHEHTRGIPGCFYEDDEWMPLTAYDPHSVMHYFCGGAGSLALELTEIDRQGHQALYGAQ